MPSPSELLLDFCTFSGCRPLFSLFELSELFELEPPLAFAESLFLSVPTFFESLLPDELSAFFGLVTILS